MKGSHNKGAKARPPVHKPKIPPILTQRQKADRDWFQAQLDKLGWSASDFSLAFTTDAAQRGKNPHVFGKTIRDERECTIAEALAMARAFNSSPYEVLKRLGYDMSQPLVPVVGLVTDAKTCEIVPADLPAVPGPPDSSTTTRAVKIAEDLRMRRAVMFYDYKGVISPLSYMQRLSYLVFATQAYPVLGTITNLSAVHSDVVQVMLFAQNEQKAFKSLRAACPITWITYLVD